MLPNKSILLLALFLMHCTGQSEKKPITQYVSGTDFSFEMVHVTSNEGNFWISRTEIPWDLYDIFVQFINSQENLYAGVDAITGPTPAYGSVDRGFGRSNYPAISMSAQAAESFCKWLSTRTNQTISIPTIEQWNSANTSDGGAWHKWNADKSTHPIATTKPNSLGIYDMRGNVGEWVTTKDGPRVIGGSFRTPAEEIGPSSLLTPIKDWNITDPQLPRSPWWFADADFVGLRIVINEGDFNE